TSDPIASGTSYTFIANDANSCSPQTVSNTKTCNCAATATISGGGTVCSGQSANMSVALTGTGPWSITYSDGTTPTTVNNIATSPYTFSSSTAGTYTITNVSDANCTGTSSGSAIVTVKQNPMVSVNDANICEGDQAILNGIVFPSGGVYNWTPGGFSTSSITVSPSSTSTYTVTYTVNGCSSSANALVTVIARPSAPIITRNNFVLTSNYPSGNQWYKDGVLIPGAVNQNYTATENGVYTVIAYDGTCYSNVSNQMVIGNVGISELALGKLLNVYPNPTKDVITIDFTKGNEVELKSIDILNLMGQKVGTVDVSESMSVDMTAFESGVYHFSFNFSEGKVVKQVVKF
ncbi:MAG: T9SS type A sorting domain-containing protein, partial [Bacteroidetes bacterium]|nr:T9SS type A sorting domain-containing protein [Bacteroidota bacterium]